MLFCSMLSYIVNIIIYFTIIYIFFTSTKTSISYKSIFVFREQFKVCKLVPYPKNKIMLNNKNIFMIQHDYIIYIIFLYNSVQWF